MKKIKKIGVTLSVAKSFSGVNKEFVTEGVFQYSKQETVDFIPIQVGLRTYLGKKIYFEPRLGIQFINFKTQTSEKHPFGKYSDLEKDSKFSFEFDLGTEIRSRFLVF
ncbi:MAG: hypothetical protein IPH28_19830 [Cytophagaceae bacterium]|nr:hypothetical protein [Cytophagaceae bacterium]